MLPQGGVKPCSGCSMDAKQGMLWRGYAHWPQQDALGRLAGHRTASPPHRQGEGGSPTQDHMTAAERSGGGPGEGCLADTRRCNRGRVRRKLQMPEDCLDHLAVRAGRNDPPSPPLTPGAARHAQGKDALQQSCPAPARRPGVRLLLGHAMLAWRVDDRTVPAAVRCSTAAIAHQVDARQGHQCRQLLQECQW